jgi:hypothetical protein
MLDGLFDLLLKLYGLIKKYATQGWQLAKENLNKAA